MKVCKNCGNEFPSWVKIDSKPHNLCNRKYCLDCSPFKQHNTRKLPNDPTAKRNTKQAHYNIEEQMWEKDCSCQFCGRQFVYSKKTRKKGFRENCCNSCAELLQKVKRKLKAVKYKGGKCELCGYNKCSDALVFHHINPKEKTMTLSGKVMAGKSWDKIQTELDKCMMVCSNCHDEIHERLDREE